MKKLRGRRSTVIGSAGMTGKSSGDGKCTTWGCVKLECSPLVRDRLGSYAEGVPEHYIRIIERSIRVGSDPLGNSLRWVAGRLWDVAASWVDLVVRVYGDMISFRGDILGRDHAHIW